MNHKEKKKPNKSKQTKKTTFKNTGDNTSLTFLWSHHAGPCGDTVLLVRAASPTHGWSTSEPHTPGGSSGGSSGGCPMREQRAGPREASGTSRALGLTAFPPPSQLRTGAGRRVPVNLTYVSLSLPRAEGTKPCLVGAEQCFVQV